MIFPCQILLSGLEMAIYNFFSSNLSSLNLTRSAQISEALYENRNVYDLCNRNRKWNFLPYPGWNRDPVLFEKKHCDCFLVKYKPDCNHDLKEMCW